VTQTGAPIFPPGRYGRRREGGHRLRPAGLLLIAVAVIALGVLSYRLYTQYGANPYEPGPVRYGEITDSHVTVTFDVTKPASGTGICRLQATDRTGAETGYAEVKVGTGAQVTTTYTMATKRRAAAVDILGCRAAPR
jgi:hypothetical protein